MNTKFFSDCYDQINAELKKPVTIAESLDNFAFWADGRKPHLDWVKLASMFRLEEENIAIEWLIKSIRAAESSVHPRGLFFGLNEFQSPDGCEFSDLYLGVYKGSENDSWMDSQSWFTKEELGSSYLKNIGVFCNRRAGKGTIGTPGYICFSLAYTSFLARALWTNSKFSWSPVNFAVGFSSGDILQLGRFEGNSFNYNQSLVK